MRARYAYGVMLSARAWRAGEARGFHIPFAQRAGGKPSAINDLAMPSRIILFIFKGLGALPAM